MTWKPDYLTAAELREYLRIDDTVDDVLLGQVIATASRAVDTATNRQFGKVDAPEERRYTARWDRRRARWVIPVDDVQTQAGLTVTVAAGAITAFTLEPVNAAQKGKPWETLVVDQDSAVKPDGTEHGVTAEALWGWTEVPSVVPSAVQLQAARFFARRDSPFGVAGSPELGSEVRLLAKLDPDVAVMLGDVVRWWAAA